MADSTNIPPELRLALIEQANSILKDHINDTDRRNDRARLWLFGTLGLVAATFLTMLNSSVTREATANANSAIEKKTGEIDDLLTRARDLELSSQKNVALIGNLQLSLEEEVKSARRRNLDLEDQYLLNSKQLENFVEDVSELEAKVALTNGKFDFSEFDRHLSTLINGNSHGPARSQIASRILPENTGLITAGRECPDDINWYKYAIYRQQESVVSGLTVTPEFPLATEFLTICISNNK